MSDPTIIERIKSGDKKSLGDVYKTFRAEFVNWAAAHFTCTRDEARDVYQAVIITFHDNVLSSKLVQLNGSLKTYLFAIGKYKILELRRGDKRYVSHTPVEEMELEDVQEWEKEKKESDLRRVEHALQQLGEPCKTMLELYYLHGMGLEELSKNLNYKNSDTIKNVKCRCLVKLRQLLNEREQGTGELDQLNTF